MLRNLLSIMLLFLFLGGAAWADNSADVAKAPVTDVANIASEEEGGGKWYLFIDGIYPTRENLELRSADDDVPTNCDGFFRGATPQTDAACARGQDRWNTRFTTVTKQPTFSVGGGRSFTGVLPFRFRIEGEYNSIKRDGNMMGFETLTGDKNVELVEAWESVDSYNTDSFLANFIVESPVDFTVFEHVNLRPWLGAGYGVARTNARYNAVWRRNPDVDYITSIGRVADAAGTKTSLTRAALQDTDPTYQFIAGVDAPIGRRFVVAYKVAFIRGTDFAASATWDQLRSHASTVAPGGDAVTLTTMSPRMNEFQHRVQLRIRIN